MSEIPDNVSTFRTRREIEAAKWKDAYEERVSFIRAELAAVAERISDRYPTHAMLDEGPWEEILAHAVNLTAEQKGGQLAARVCELMARNVREHDGRPTPAFNPLSPDGAA